MILILRKKDSGVGYIIAKKGYHKLASLLLCYIRGLQIRPKQKKLMSQLSSEIQKNKRKYLNENHGIYVWCLSFNFVFLLYSAFSN